MALTRKLLKGMGLTDEQVDTIIEAHTDTVEGLKSQINTYESDMEKLSKVQAELDELKSRGDDGYKDKYENEHSEFEKYKADVEAEKNVAANEKAYRTLLKGAGIKAKFIDTVIRAERSVIENIKMSDGKIDGADELTANARKNWADFVEVVSTETAEAENPPGDNGGGDDPKNLADALRQKYELKG